MSKAKKRDKLKKKICKQCGFGVVVGKKVYCINDVCKVCDDFSRKER